MKLLISSIVFAYLITTLYGKPPPIVTPEDNEVITRQKRELLIPGIPRAHHSATRSKRSIIHSPEYMQLAEEEASGPGEETEYAYQKSYGPRHPNVLASDRNKEEVAALTAAEELALLIEEELEQEPPKSIFRERQRLLRNNGARQTRTRLNIPDGNPSYGSIFRERQRTLAGKPGKGLDLPAFQEVKRDDTAHDFVRALFEVYLERNPQLSDDEKENLWEFLQNVAAESEDVEKRTPGRIGVLSSGRRGSGSGSYNNRYGNRRQGRSIPSNVDDLPQALEVSDQNNVSNYFKNEKDTLAMRKRYALNHHKDFVPKTHGHTQNGSQKHDNNPTTTAPQSGTTSLSA